MDLLADIHFIESPENFEHIFQKLLASKKYSQILVLVDENTRKYCLEQIHPFLPDYRVIEIASGEPHKNLMTCQHIWQKMTEARSDRHSLMINLGGGVIGDMGGFCAATYKRGIDFIQVPTTLLAQIDASVGGKLGIDFLGFKNHIGLFRMPKAVLIYPEFLQTLPNREFRSGFAEMVKHGLIADRPQWEYLRRHQNLEAIPKEVLLDLIKGSVKIKALVVQDDPTEKGHRKILNFGHTIGHAIESAYLRQPEPLLHGEAIAIGMICEAYLSQEVCGLAYEAVEEIVQYLKMIYHDLAIDSPLFEEITQAVWQDKKNESGQINASLLKQIGQAVYDQSLSPEQIRQALTFFQEQSVL